MTEDGQKNRFDDQVILDVAKKAIATHSGVHSLSPSFIDDIVDGITKRFGQKKLPGINIKHRKHFTEINVYLRVYYGQNIVELSKSIQREIIQQMKHILDMDQVRVDVHIESIEPLPKETV